MSLQEVRFTWPTRTGVGLDQTVQKSRVVDQTNIQITNSWLNVNNWLIDHVLPHLEWDITIDEALDLSMQGRYLMTCNHQSWVDTTVNQYFGLTRMPLTRFYQMGAYFYSLCGTSLQDFRLPNDETSYQRTNPEKSRAQNS